MNKWRRAHVRRSRDVDAARIARFPDTWHRIRTCKVLRFPSKTAHRVPCVQRLAVDLAGGSVKGENRLKIAVFTGVFTWNETILGVPVSRSQTAGPISYSHSNQSANKAISAQEEKNWALVTIPGLVIYEQSRTLFRFVSSIKFVRGSTMTVLTSGQLNLRAFVISDHSKPRVIRISQT